MSLIPVTKKNNPAFFGFASAEQIAASNGALVIAGKTAQADQLVAKAKADADEKAKFDASVAAAKPSEALKPSDIKRKPAAPE
jgi:hypothetical protein